jgi:hypothetical protein
MKADILWALCDKGRGTTEGPSAAHPHPNPPNKWGGSDLTSPTPWGRLGGGGPNPSPKGDEKTWGGPAFS